MVVVEFIYAILFNIIIEYVPQVYLCMRTSLWPMKNEGVSLIVFHKTYGVFFSTKKCALYFKKCNFLFVS